MSKHKMTFGEMDIPLSCSFFLEPALVRYAGFVTPLSRDMHEFIHEWNTALLYEVSLPQYSEFIGDLGRKIMRNVSRFSDYATRCVECGSDIQLQALHYALRFDQGMRLLNQRALQSNPEKPVNFVELGIGFSPMTALFQNQCKTSNAYCIDTPVITDVYGAVSDKLGVAPPNPIEWRHACQMAREYKLDTIVALGVLPYIDLNEQVARLKMINQRFPNFLVEIKYNNAANRGKNVFNLDQLQELKMSVENTATLESTMINNSLRYLHKFLCAMPNKKYFLIGDRSLFLQR